LSLLKGAHWAFYVYELVYFLNPEKRWWSAGVPLSKYSLIAVVFLILTYALQRNKYSLNKFHEIPQFKWLVLLLLSYSITYFFAVNKGIHLSALIEFAKLFIVIGIAYKVLDSMKKVEYSIYALIVGIAYLGYEANALGRDEYGRVGRFGMIDAPDVNVACAAMISALPFLIFYFWRGSVKVKIIMTFFGAIIINALVLANSRGAFIGAFVGVTYFIWEMLRSKFKVKFQRSIAVMLIVLGLAGLSVVIDSSFIERMNTLSDVSDGSKSGSHRTAFWLIAIDMSKDYPFGAGARGFELLSPINVPQEYFDVGKTSKAVHSLWFQALTELGYIGFFFFMALIFCTLTSLRKIKRRCFEVNDIHGFYFTHALLCSFIGVLAASSFINQFRTQIIYWLILFVACLVNIVLIKKGGSTSSEGEGVIIKSKNYPSCKPNKALIDKSTSDKK